MGNCFRFLRFLLLFSFLSFSKPDTIPCVANKYSYYFGCFSSNLTHVVLRENLLDKINETGLDRSNVKTLWLKGNVVKLIPGFFKGFKKLIYLVLQNTAQTEISSEHFKGLEKIRYVDLSYNFLTTLPSDFIKTIKGNRTGTTIYLLLEGNKWNCTCGSGLDRAMVDLEGIFFVRKPLCSIPDSLRKTPIYNFTCDIDECMEENDCDDMAVCSNRVGGYNCECATKGFKGSGKECTDINECEGENLCASVGGKCINEQGKYRCECRVGFKGDGITCEDVDECETHDCGMQGECTNTVGSFRCDCDSGFEKNDRHVCVDIDECGTNNHTCDTIEHSFCFNLRKLLPKDPGYECVCDSRYRKVGQVCVRRGSTLELVKYVGAIVGGFFVGLIFIIVGSVWLRKRLLRQLEAQQLFEDTMLMGPVVAMPPPMGFSSLNMPQATLPKPGKTKEWEDDDDDEG